MTCRISTTSSLRRCPTAAFRKGGPPVFGIAGVLALGWAVLAFAGPASTQEANPSTIGYASSADPGEAVVTGTSTLHDWTVKSGAIKGNAEFSGQWQPDSGKTIALQSIDLSIPVDSLKSTEGSGMDNVMYDALNHKNFPTIAFKLEKATLKGSPSKEDSAYHFGATGQLSISGNTHSWNLDLSVTPTGDSKLTISTAAKLKMTDFGVKPPTAMLGTIRSGDSIVVKVTWQLTKQP
jgi:polyisoprenoid-binding protein YceI